MNKREIMKKAHSMAKEIKIENPSVDYKFQLGLCLTYLHEEIKRIESLLIKEGNKVWEKGNMRRVYVNDLGSLAKSVGYEFSNPKLFAKSKFYYDSTEDTFCYTATSSVKKHVLEVIELIRG